MLVALLPAHGRRRRCSLSALYVRFRDVAPIWSVVSTALFYGSPVLYTIESVPEDWRTLYLCNPLASLLEQARHWVIDPNSPGIVDAIGGVGWALIPLAIGVAICVPRLLGLQPRSAANRRAPLTRTTSSGSSEPSQTLLELVRPSSLPLHPLEPG